MVAGSQPWQVRWPDGWPRLAASNPSSRVYYLLETFAAPFMYMAASSATV